MARKFEKWLERTKKKWVGIIQIIPISQFGDLISRIWVNWESTNTIMKIGILEEGWCSLMGISKNLSSDIKRKREWMLHGMKSFHRNYIKISQEHRLWTFYKRFYYSDSLTCLRHAICTDYSITRTGKVEVWDIHFFFWTYIIWLQEKKFFFENFMIRWEMRPSPIRDQKC